MSTMSVIVAVIVLLALQVDVSSAVDDIGGSSESDIISFIRLNDVKHIREELKDVKDMTKDLREATTACAANQSICCSSLEEEMRQIKGELQEVKPTLEATQQQCSAAVNRSTLNEDVVRQLRQDFVEDVKTACASNQSTDCSSVNTTSLEVEMRQVKEELKDMKTIIQQQQQSAVCNTSSLEEEIKQLKRDLQNAPTSGISRCIPVLIQQNIDGSNFFNRSWAEFKVGFNDSNGNYWIGNDRLSLLTLSGVSGRYKLRFELQARDNSSWYWAEYSSFTVLGESRNYMLQVSGYSGNAGYDALGYSNGMMFTTYDRDNDPYTSSSYNGNCAVLNGGGFWYNKCSWCSVNVVRGRRRDFKWYTTLLRTSRMWLTC